jgi:L-asparaginase
MKNNDTKILVIYTGGTIGMARDPLTGALHPFDFQRMYEHIPYLKNFDCCIEVFSFNTLIDSSNVTTDFWIRLAETIEQNYDAFDGFIILHGTDTMSYSASMLSFMLGNLCKPVVFTGSQLPMGVIRTDGRDNFINAVEIASARINGRPVVPEVSLYFENKLYRGNRSSKLNSENFQAFISGNYPPLAEVGVSIRYNTASIMTCENKPLKVYKSLDNNVALLKLFPGINSNITKAITGAENLRALVMETYGSGNAPTDEWFLEILEKAVQNDIVIVNVTQCKEGSVEHGRYATSIELERIGVVSGFDITTESAITKLMFLLGRGYDAPTVKELMQKPLRGEMAQ